MRRPPATIKFFSFLWKQFAHLQSWMGGVIALAASVGFFLLAPEAKVSAGYMVAAILLSFVIIITLIRGVLDAIELHNRIAFDLSGQATPKLKQAMDLPSTQQTDDFLLLLEPSSLFPLGACVSFYYFEDNFEQFIGLGKVTRIQVDGMVQVLLVWYPPGHKKILEKIQANDTTYLSRIMVMPYVLHDEIRQARFE
jgi:hypothetical protein